MQFSTILSLTVVASMAILSTMAAPAAPVCIKACTKIYKPVCAKLQSGENKTFGNKCTLEVFNCENPTALATVVANGECPVTPAPACKKACPKIYAPVCAKLQSGENKTFANKCTLEVFNCENPTSLATVVANGECPVTPAPACKKACTKEYRPVCAKLQSGENKTFGNKCTLEVFNCENPTALATVVANGECPVTPAPACKKACPKIYAPVCAKLQSGENKTFANKCTLEVFNCENPTSLATVVANGECPVTPAPACKKACTKEYRPVCAKLQSGENKTFGNKCTLEVFNCENPTALATVVANGECPVTPAPACKKACPKIYAPVCAKLQSGENKTFANKCTLEVFNCENPTSLATVVDNGECPATPAPACKKACPKIYAPVCAKLQSGENKTFANKCTLEVFNCENPTSLATVVAETACKN